MGIFSRSDDRDLRNYREAKRKLDAYRGKDADSRRYLELNRRVEESGKRLSWWHR